MFLVKEAPSLRKNGFVLSEKVPWKPESNRVLDRLLCAGLSFRHDSGQRFAVLFGFHDSYVWCDIVTKLEEKPLCVVAGFYPFSPEQSYARIHHLHQASRPLHGGKEVFVAITKEPRCNRVWIDIRARADRLCEYSSFVRSDWNVFVDLNSYDMVSILILDVVERYACKVWALRQGSESGNLSLSSYDAFGSFVIKNNETTDLIRIKIQRKHQSIQIDAESRIGHERLVCEKVGPSTRCNTATKETAFELQDGIQLRFAVSCKSTLAGPDFYVKVTQAQDTICHEPN